MRVLIRWCSLSLLLLGIAWSDDGRCLSQAAQQSDANPPIPDQPAKSQTASGANGQHFFCNVGYSLQECLAEIARLRAALRKYPTKALGEWSWILVKTNDWKPLLASRGLHRNTPALTCLELRETFIEEAIVIDTGTRTMELQAQWKMNLESLLDFAIAHELGHGFCNDLNEEKANYAAKMLQSNQPFSCPASRQRQVAQNMPALSITGPPYR